MSRLGINASDNIPKGSLTVLLFPAVPLSDKRLMDSVLFSPPYCWPLTVAQGCWSAIHKKGLSFTPQNWVLWGLCASGSNCHLGAAEAFHDSLSLEAAVASTQAVWLFLLPNYCVLIFLPVVPASMLPKCQLSSAHHLSVNVVLL